MRKTIESVNVIKEYVEHPEYGKKITYWVSEVDTGLYNAMKNMPLHRIMLFV